MKKAWFAAGLLAFMVTFCMVINHIVTRYAGEILDCLDEAEWLADQGDFEGAQGRVIEAITLCEDKMPLFSMSIPTSRTNEVDSLLQEVLEQLACRDYKTYKARNALLVSELGTLSEGYKANWATVM